MGLKDSQLAEGEHIILNLRGHWKILFVPTVVLVLLAAAFGVTWWFTRDLDYVMWVLLGVAALALVLGVIFVGLPYWRWASSYFVITNRRVAQRSGLLTKVGRDIPLHRINDVAVTRTPLDRILGCGNLLLSDATEKAGMELVDIPRVEQVQVQIQNLLYRHDDGSDDGEWPPNEPDRPRGRN